jgi:Mg-chelatase subunit ChlD
MGSFVDPGRKGLLLLLFIAALLGVDPDIRGWGPVPGVCTIFVMDVSSSISAASREYGKRLVVRYEDRMSRRDQAGLVVFAGEPRLVMAPRRIDPQHRNLWSDVMLDPGETHIADALRFAGILFPEGYQKRIVLLTDGRETGDPRAVTEAASRLGLDGIMIHVVPLGGERSSGLLLKNLHLPEEVQPGLPFLAQGVIGGSGDGDLKVYRNGVLKYEEKIRKANRSDQVFPITLKEDAAGYVQYDLELISGSATDPTTQRRRGIVRVEGRPKVLYLVGSRGEKEGPPLLAEVLRSQRIPLQIVNVETTEIPLILHPLDWSRYGAVVIDNVPASALSPDIRTLLQQYVHQWGGGLMLVGGENGFGPGGYGETPIETMMPVSMDIPSGVRASGMELGLLLDKSGSMDERSETRTKWNRAIFAATETLKVLRPGDAVGLIAFDSDPHEIFPLQRNVDGGMIRSRLDDVSPGGGTDIHRALEQALGWFQGRTAGPGQVRHLLLLSDGQTRPFDVAAISAQLNEERVTVSAIGIGDPGDEGILRELTAATGGRFYREGDAGVSSDALSEIFRRDTVAASERWMVTSPSIPRLKGRLDGLEIILAPHERAFPILQGYVRTSPKGPAQVLLETDHGDPLVAAWHYGEGRTIAFTSDGSGQWSGQWLNWPPFQGFLGNLVRWGMTPQARDPLNEYRRALALTHISHAPQEDPGGVPDYPLLQQIASLTGGRPLLPEDDPFAAEEGQRAPAAHGEVWPIFLSAIFVIYLLDIAAERGVRIPWSRLRRLLRPNENRKGPGNLP